MFASKRTDNTHKAHVARARRRTRIASVSHGGLWDGDGGRGGGEDCGAEADQRPNEGDGGNGEGGDAQRGVNWGEGGGEGGGGVRWWRWWQRHLARQKHMGGDGGGGSEEGGVGGGNVAVI